MKQGQGYISIKKLTINEYIELIDELCAKSDSGELTEEGVNDILAEITISEWKSDHVNYMMYRMIIYHLVVIVNMMTIEELMNKLGLAEVSKADRQLLDHLLHLYNTGQIKAVSISREEALLQMADAYLNNCLPQIDDIIYRD